MTWVRVDDHFDEHPKMQEVGPLGWGIWLAGLAYCNRNLTDGFIPWTKARTLCSFELVDDDGVLWTLGRTSGMSGDDITSDWIIGHLVQAGLWEQVENGRGRVEGYRIHDYDDYQPTKSEIEAQREAKQRAGRAGGQASAEARAQASVEQEPSTDSSKTEAKSNPVPKPTPVPVPIPVPRETRDSAESLGAANTTQQAEKPKRVDALFEAVVAVCYHKPYTDITDDERGRVNRAMPQLRKMNATPEDVYARQAEYDARGLVDFTPQTLTKKWTSLGTPQPARASPNDKRGGLNMNDLERLYREAGGGT